MTHNAALAAEPTETGNSATQDIDDFIYLMSHDVRASVRALLELPQWIAEDIEESGIAITDSVARSIELMNRHTARLDRMLIDMLAYSRVGRMQDMVSVNISNALDEVLVGLRLPDTMRLTRDIGCAEVLMGEQDALLMLSVLIGNAVKHHHRTIGQITISTRLENRRFCLTVTDDGPGIPERFWPKVVSPMTTLRPRDEVEGTGMGLANARKIAAHYGGVLILGNLPDCETGLQVTLKIPQG